MRLAIVRSFQDHGIYPPPFQIASDGMLAPEYVFLQLLLCDWVIAVLLE